MKAIYSLTFLLFFCRPVNGQDLIQMKSELQRTTTDTSKARLLHQLSAYSPEGEWMNYNKQLKQLCEKKLQQPVAPGLKKIYSGHLAFSYNRLGNLELAYGNFDQALQKHSFAKKIATNINDQIGIGDAYIGFGNIHYYKGDLTKAMNDFQLALKNYRKAHHQLGIATALGRIGIIYNERGDNAKALKLYRKSLEINQKIGYLLGIAQGLNNIGLVYHNSGNIPKALGYYQKSLKIKEQIGNKAGIASSLNSIGVVYFDQHDLTNALLFFQRALALRKILGNKEGIAASYGNIGVIYQQQGKSEKALACFQKALKIDKEIGDLAGIAASLNNLGDVNFKMGKVDLALQQHQEALKIQEKIDEKEGIAASLINLGEIYRKQGKLEIADAVSKRSLAIAQEIGYYEPIRDAAHSLYLTNKAKGKTAQALTFFELYIQMRDSVTNEENQQAATELKFRYAYEKKTAEDRIRDAEEKKLISAQFQQEQTQRYALYGGLTLLTLFGGFMFNRFRVTSRQKQVIEFQEKETKYQKHLIEEKQQEILDSISYAKRLQEAILPPISAISANIPENFILYKPKDIVAGDFYWAESTHDLFFIAAADSTGHGVPGAMVSVVCSNALNRSVKEFGLTDPGKILDKTRELVIETFAKNTTDVKDGMDISLLCIDRKNHRVFWSGANNPLWYFNKDNLVEIKADKQPIGRSEIFHSFTTYEIPMQEMTTCYLFTDGYADQFGGSKGKKFKNSQFKELLHEIQSLPLIEQGSAIEKRFEDWKSDLEQVDDVCILGLRIQ